MLVPSHAEAASHLSPLSELSHLCCIFFKAGAAQPDDLVPCTRRWHCRVRCSFPNKSESISAGSGTAEPGVFMPFPCYADLFQSHTVIMCVLLGLVLSIFMTQSLVTMNLLRHFIAQSFRIVRSSPSFSQAALDLTVLEA